MSYRRRIYGPASLEVNMNIHSPEGKIGIGGWLLIITAVAIIAADILGVLPK